MLNDLIQYIEILLSLTAEMAPYLLLGFILAGITHTFFPREWIKTHLGGNGFSQSFKASLFGVPLPVCSCGIIPLAKELKKSGASNPGVASFLASTPQTGVDSIVATAGLMGWPFAILRVIVAFVSGILTGSLIGLAEKNLTTGKGTEKAPPSSHKKTSILQTLRYSLFDLPGEIRNSLSLGLIIAALIALLLPEYREFSGGDKIWMGYIGAISLAIPLYVCSTGSIPIAIALIASGFSPGAALIFLIAGPATNIVTLITMTEIIGVKNTMIYLLSVVGIAITFAIIVDSSLLNLNFTSQLHHHHESGITLFQWICLTILLIGLYYQMCQRFGVKLIRSIQHNRSTIKWESFSIQVEGMGCKKCATKVTALLETLPHFKNIQIDLKDGIVTFEAEKMDLKEISKKLSPEGYSIKQNPHS